MNPKTPLAAASIFVGGCLVIAISVVDATRSLQANERPMTQEQQRALVQQVQSAQDPLAPLERLAGKRPRILNAVPSDDPYVLLNISRGASRDEVRAAYIEAIRAAHPDVNPSVDTTRAAASINAAYEALIQGEGADSSRWGTASAPADVFDAPEAEATELFVNPFGISGVSPLAWRELQAVARRGVDPAEALWQAGLAVTESGVQRLTPEQLAAVEAELERLDLDPSPVGLEVAAWVLADQLARARRANARQPASRRGR
ncbi:hypothetical protein WJX81_003309 [Elliptochloris bilobata]|uniref:J domain-containing protein n=1 Tax=Elliptochloris bilobata TaxID=381761 RepID=A0AAW1RFL4_9CHLO